MKFLFDLKWGVVRIPIAIGIRTTPTYLKTYSKIRLKVTECSDSLLSGDE